MPTADTTKCRRGDIIRSRSFIDGQFPSEFVDGKLVRARGAIAVAVQASTYGWTERQTLPADDGLSPWHRDVPRQLDVNAHDPTRGDALFLVTDARSGGGGYGHGPGDYYPDGWCVTAVRLDSLGKRTKERIKFYQHSCFNGNVNDVEIVGHKEIDNDDDR